MALYIVRNVDDLVVDAVVCEKDDVFSGIIEVDSDFKNKTSNNMHLINVGTLKWEENNISNTVKKLSRMYTEIVATVEQLKCSSVVIPLLSSKDDHYQVRRGTNVINNDLLKAVQDKDIDIYLLVEDSTKLFVPKSVLDELDYYLETGSYFSHKSSGYGDCLKYDLTQEDELILETFREQKESTWIDMLNEKIREKYKKMGDFYADTEITRQLYSKYQKGTKPHRDFVLTIAIGMGLTLSETKKFMAKASYAFNDSLADKVIQYCLGKNTLTKKVMSLQDVKLILFEKADFTFASDKQNRIR